MMGNNWIKRVCLFGSTLLAASSAYAVQPYNLTQGVTDISADVYGLHMIAFWLCVAIGVVVFGVMFYSIFAHRKSKGVQPATFHESTTAEAIWTFIPFVILIGLALPATKTLIAMEDTSDYDMTIKITGYQWLWHYEYIDEGVNFYSALDTPRTQINNIDNKNQNYLLEVDNQLVLPVGKKVRFLITSNDVIHSWWVPALAVKKDAVPGFINEAWTRINEPGVYRGQCAELCGRDHGFMPVVVRAVPEAEFDQFLAANTTLDKTTEYALAE
ncbi:MAG: cytochrome c oxidase subunit II [Gammaproteobacteria bacterium TMED119]|nr:MAG: cytochrome c oxidase subunit II [Gammaproteobacteria bacterium TMED119]|tara:strand:+ start:1417 stop:2229 length:813 start_codon:yes stop_codon:yes gene_type:complete